ncbi:AI-2E family transporter [Halocola ammonii]
MSTQNFPTYAKFAFIAIGVTLVIVAMTYARTLLLPLSWAVLFSLLILPIQKKLERWLRYRVLATFGSVIILTIIIGGVIFLLSSQIGNLLNDMPVLMRKLNNHLEDLRQFIDSHLGIPYKEQPSEFFNRISGFLQDSVSSIGIALSNTVKTIVFLGMLPVYTFFILLYRNRIKQFFQLLYQNEHRDAVLHTVWKSTNVVQQYLTGMVVVTSVVAVLVYLLFTILGVKHAIFFAIFLAVFNLIPFVGVFIASLVSILYVMITKDGLFYPIITLACLWGIQILENNIITPLIVGRHVQLNPLAVLVAIVLGGIIWGVSGMILFIPLLGGLKVILDNNPSSRPYGFLLGDDPAEN